jgi:hypothetical protein
MSNSSPSQDATVDNADNTTGEQIVVEDNDEEEMVFKSARESADHDDNDDSIMGGVKDTMITEPMPSKYLSAIDAGNTSEKKNHALLTPKYDDDMYEDKVEYTHPRFHQASVRYPFSL